MSKTIIFAVVAVVVLTIGGIFLPKFVGDTLEQASTEVKSPSQRFVSDVSEFIERFLHGFTRLDALQKEVLTLRDENQRLASENQRLWAWAKENETLREMLAFKTNEVHFRLLAVRVEGRELSNWWNAVIVNRGREDDPALREDLPVVSPRGVVGKTGKVGSRTTQVVLIIDENCRISARTENSRAQGIVQGATTINGGKPECRIQFIARDTKFMVGERVFTTGLGGTFPANLLIGTISEAPDLSANRNFGLYREGVVEPNADMENLEKLFVVLGIK